MNKSNIKRKTIENDEEYLRQKSLPVDLKNDNIEEILAILKEFCNENSVFALAPVQIGIPKRIIYIKNSSSDMNKNFTEGYDESIIYINPKIINSYGTTYFLEGCASCKYEKNGESIYYVSLIKRPYKIDVEYQDINGNKKFKTIEGFEATVFSHEYDHLNGILHIDFAREVIEMNSSEMKDYRTKHPYNIISKTGKYERVVNIKDNFDFE